jgi:hypothetical protein
VKARSSNSGLVFILLLLTPIFSLIIIASPVLAGGVASYPIGTIVVQQGQTFLLRHELYFDEPEYGGYFALAVSWDAPSSDENFALENAPSLYWITGPENGLPVENVLWETRDTGLGGWQVGIWIDSENKNYVDGHFNIDIWLRACSGDGTLHREDDNHQLSYGLGIVVIESTPRIEEIKNLTVDVRGIFLHTEFPRFYAAIAVVFVGTIIAILAAWMWRRSGGRSRLCLGLAMRGTCLEQQGLR